MIHIICLAVMGVIAGTIAGFWTRIIRPEMILWKVGRWGTNNARTYDQKIIDVVLEKKLTWRSALLEKFTFLIQCIFCIVPWLCFALDACYIIIYTPAWYLCIIGVFASLGAGNIVAEIIYALRGRE